MPRPKSREGDHFGAAIGLRSLLESFTPTIPEFALDQHTLAGKKLGRGLDHFRKEGAKPVPEPTAPDPYIEEAYRLWAIKHARPMTGSATKQSIYPRAEAWIASLRSQ